MQLLGSNEIRPAAWAMFFRQYTRDTSAVGEWLAHHRHCVLFIPGYMPTLVAKMVQLSEPLL